jgi:tetratricopeptide (TPR) repeat protein
VSSLARASERGSFAGLAIKFSTLLFEHTSMPRRFVSLLALSICLLSGTFGLAQEVDRPKPKAEPLPPKPPPPDEPAPEDGGPIAFRHSTDEAIAFFQSRIAASPTDAGNYRYLGELYERKAGESADHAIWYAKAEETLRKAIELLPDFPRAEASLAFVLCARHQFAEALSIAQNLMQRVPNDLDALATSGDALVELGRYEEAAKAYDQLFAAAQSGPILARLANLAEYHGRLDEAIDTMRKASELARANGRPKADAWYVMRLAELNFLAGRLDEAESLYRSVPNDVDPFHDATAGLGRLMASRGDVDSAIVLYEKAVAIGPDPHMLVALGDLYTSKGEQAKADALFARFLDATGDNSETRRERAMFLADHGQKLEEAVALARRDHAERPGIYAEDCLAWCLNRAKQDPEQSRELITKALRLGTRDPRLHYHAGAIFAASGDSKRAIEELQKALELNRRFHPSQADDAQRLLKELGAAR